LLLQQPQQLTLHTTGSWKLMAAARMLPGHLVAATAGSVLFYILLFIINLLLFIIIYYYFIIIIYYYFIKLLAWQLSSQQLWATPLLYCPPFLQHAPAAVWLASQ
jgi:hypothetical protein